VAVHGGHYLVVLDKDQAAYVCRFITEGGDAGAFLARFRDAVSPGFDPDLHLARLGCANQTTMLSSESLEIGEMFRDAMQARFGAAELPRRFRAFDTICSATQDRQDAVIRLLAEQALDLMVVVGGYNSSNTCNLARLCGARVPTFHIAAPDGLVSAELIRHRDVLSKAEVTTSGWLPAGGRLSIGVTSGASTPDNLVEQVIRTLDRFVNPPASDLPQG
jgi:4-hydroxy-3-methylbut-2-enyl diphosphate reductase